MKRAHLPVVTALLLLAAMGGCTFGSSYTLVEGRLKPSHFRFVTVIEKTGAEPGGWRAACIHLNHRNDTGAAYLCKFGVEVPLSTSQGGDISTPQAQRVAARCANLVAPLSFGATTAATPLGLACTSFIQEYRAALDRALPGSRVTQSCRPWSESGDMP
ncbi:hypothetical protein P2318_13240 [Myxococcaceae bacterium GXIMD 01537]